MSPGLSMPLPWLYQGLHGLHPQAAPESWVCIPAEPQKGNREGRLAVSPVPSATHPLLPLVFSPSSLLAHVP